MILALSLRRTQIPNHTQGTGIELEGERHARGVKALTALFSSSGDGAEMRARALARVGMAATNDGYSDSYSAVTEGRVGLRHGDILDEGSTRGSLLSACTMRSYHDAAQHHTTRLHETRRHDTTQHASNQHNPTQHLVDEVSTVTHLYMASLTWPKSLREEIAALLQNRTRFPTLQTGRLSTYQVGNFLKPLNASAHPCCLLWCGVAVASLVKLPGLEESWGAPSMEEMQMSWSRATVYLYRWIDPDVKTGAQ